MQFFSDIPEIQKPMRKCDVPFCDKECEESPMFSHKNITCMRCDKFHCDDCSKQIWTGEWNGEVFHKPVINFIVGLRHEMFRCAFCRVTFDRFNEE
jgi:hypothetical protein